MLSEEHVGNRVRSTLCQHHFGVCFWWIFVCFFGFFLAFTGFYLKFWKTCPSDKYLEHSSPECVDLGLGGYSSAKCGR